MKVIYTWQAESPNRRAVMWDVFPRHYIYDRNNVRSMWRMWHIAPKGIRDFLSDASSCELRMHRECRERFPRHRLQREPLVSDPDMRHDTCHDACWNRGGGENVPSIPGACATRNFTYLARGPLIINCEAAGRCCQFPQRWEADIKRVH